MSKHQFIGMVAKEKIHRVLLTPAQRKDVVTYEGSACGTYFKIEVGDSIENGVSVTRDERVWVVCFGYSVHMANLSEAIHQQYCLGGVNAVIATKGYYNFFIFDQTSGHAFVGGDGTGICPLYYHASQEKLIFSSRLQAVADCLRQKPDFNYLVLYELFHTGIVMPPDTLIKDVFSLPAKRYLHFSNKLMTEAFHEKRLEKLPLDVDVLQHQLDEVFSPLEKFNKLGLTYSGGFDSSFIAQYLSQCLSKRPHLMTVNFDRKQKDFLNFQDLLKEKSKDCSIFDEHSGDKYLAVIDESIDFMESEAVGTLSFNLALELLFSRFVKEFDYELILTGDTDFIRLDGLRDRDINTYSTQYGVLQEGVEKEKIKNNNRWGYLNFLHKYQGLSKGAGADLKQQKLLFPEVLSVRLAGKLRMQVGHGQRYYLPFIDQDYVRYMECLNFANPALNHRAVLRNFSLENNFLTKKMLNTKKMWMPSFLGAVFTDENKKHLLAVFNHKESFCYSLFGCNFDSLLKEKKYRFLMTLVYLEKFFNKFF